ncbi:MAG: DUF2029 domain-containing protein [Phycisphaerales bacterium]|nr:DUF2029 domain-containing protein [Phycisphaerales bacterium]
MTPAPRNPRSPRIPPHWFADRTSVIQAWLIWLGTLATVCVLVALAPDKKTVTPEYRRAAENWWHSADLYAHGGHHGYLYLPHGAIAYTPLTWLPVAAGEVLWRIIATLLLAHAVHRLCRLVSPAPGPALFFLTSLLTIPAAAGNMQNGQFNLPMAAFMIHLAADLARRRWWAAAAWAAVLLAIKPVTLPIVLLAAAVYPRCGLRMLATIPAMLALPFAHRDPAFVLDQHRMFADKLRAASAPPWGDYQDIAGILFSLGLHPPDAAMTILRAAFAPITLAFAWLARRRWPEPHAAFALLALAAGYMMLFSPRTEGLTYVALAPVVGVAAAAAVWLDRRPAPALALIAAGLALGFSQVITQNGSPNVWLRPAVTALLMLALAAAVLLNIRPFGRAPSPSPPTARPPAPEPNPRAA